MKGKDWGMKARSEDGVSKRKQGLGDESKDWGRVNKRKQGLGEDR